MLPTRNPRFSMVGGAGVVAGGVGAEATASKSVGFGFRSGGADRCGTLSDGAAAIGARSSARGVGAAGRAGSARASDTGGGVATRGTADGTLAGGDEDCAVEDEGATGGRVRSSRRPGPVSDGGAAATRSRLASPGRVARLRLAVARDAGDPAGLVGSRRTSGRAAPTRDGAGAAVRERATLGFSGGCGGAT